MAPNDMNMPSPPVETTDPIKMKQLTLDHNIHINHHDESNIDLKALHVDASDLKAIKSESNSTFLQAAFNCTSLLLGLGVLSSPYAIAQSGWLGAGMALVVAAMYAYAALLMARCQKQTGAGTYQELAELALGRRVSLFIEFFFYLELAGSLMGYCISIGDNLAHVFPNARLGIPGVLSAHNILLLLACLCILPTVWLRDLSALSFTSVWSVLNTLLLIISVFVAATADSHIGFRHAIPAVELKGAPVAAGLYAFAFGGTTVYPSVYKSMRDPTKFTYVLLLSFGIATGFVVGLGIMGASMFGSLTASQVTLNLPPHKVTTHMALWLTVLTPTFMFALVMSPISKSMDAGVNRRLRKYPARLQMAVATLARSCVMALIVVGAMALPYFNYVVALIGSSMTIAICLVFPCVFYAILCRDRLNRSSIAAIAIVSIFSAIAAVCGTIVSFQGLVESRKHHRSSS